MFGDLVAIPRCETNSLNKKPVRQHRVTIRRGTGRVNLKQQSTGIEGLVPKYFDVSFYIVKLLLSAVIQTVVFDKCNIQFLPCTSPLQFLMYCYFP